MVGKVAGQQVSELVVQRRGRARNPESSTCQRRLVGTDQLICGAGGTGMGSAALLAGVGSVSTFGSVGGAKVSLGPSDDERCPAAAPDRPTRSGHHVSVIFTCTCIENTSVCQCVRGLRGHV